MTSTSKNVSTVNTTYSGYGAVPPGATVGGVIGASGQYTIGTNAGSNGTWATGSSIRGLSATGIITDSKMNINVPLEVNGRDILKELDELRDAMMLLKRHVDMEDKYPKLKELKDAYERQLEKYKTFDAIKDSK